MSRDCGIYDYESNSMIYSGDSPESNMASAILVVWLRDAAGAGGVKFDEQAEAIDGLLCDDTSDSRYSTKCDLAYVANTTEDYLRDAGLLIYNKVMTKLMKGNVK